MLKDRVLARLKHIKTKDPAYLKKIDFVDDYFLRLIAPKNLDGMSQQNVIIQTRKEFEKLCVILLDRGIQRPEMMTVLRFYSTIKHYESQKSQGQKVKSR